MSDEGDSRRDADETDAAFDEIDDIAAETDDIDDIDDPFAELGAGVGGGDSDGSDPADSGGAGPADFDPADSDAGDSASDPVSAGDDPAASRDDFFDEIGPADSETDLDDAFERMDVGGVAEEDVWESLDADLGTADGVAGATEGVSGTADAAAGATSVSGGADTEHVVSKRTYCQQCPHFTSPPDVACTHEGTSILESIGFDEFRVRNCPMISEEDPTFDPDS